MNRIQRIRRFSAIVAGMASALLAFAAAAPAALASGQPPLPRPPGWNKHPPLPPGHVIGPVYKVPAPVRTVVIGGMPGWQITLIAIGAALLAATAAVVVYRVWATRRKPVTAAA
jgi:hypothetical protein